MNKEIVGLSQEELEIEFEKLNIEKYRVKQLWNWIYFHGIKNFNEINNFSKELKLTLTEYFTLKRPIISNKQISIDGTIKWLLEFDDKEKVEMVYIPAEDRGTLCISSQVGCPMGCKFCNTGYHGYIRNLSSSEIVNEVLIARDELNEWNNLNKKIGEGRLISNIVVMGMGEPLLNYNNIVKSLKIIMDQDGIAFSNRRITLSSCGIVPQIKQLGNDIKINLAISLHATTDKIRQKIMPIAEKYSIEELLKACGEYAKKTNNRRITFEYIMINNLNDSKEDAYRLINLIKKYKIPAKFNLIPFNYWKGCIFSEPSSKEKIENFSKILTKHNYPAPIRTPRGNDILAACGQLKNKNK